MNNGYIYQETITQDWRETMHFFICIFKLWNISQLLSMELLTLNLCHFSKNFVQLGNVIKLIKSQLLQNEPLRRNWLPSISSHALGTIVNSWMADCEHGCVWSEKVQSNPFSILFMIRIFIETSIWFTHILWLPLYTKVHSKCRSVAFLPRRQIALSHARNS